MRIAVTGANGFVGRALVSRLETETELDVVGLVRDPTKIPVAGGQYAAIGDLGRADYGAGHLNGIDVVVHTAARVHVMRDQSADPLGEFRRANVAGTLALAQRSIEAGVRRFIFVSSLKVNGESSSLGNPIRCDDPVAPKDAYAISKSEAEDGLRDLAARTGLELVIVRPPLVYGPDAGGNFAALAKWLRMGICLPLGSITDNGVVLSPWIISWTCW